eukprot:749684-Hanusia_phi.AAC.1
MRVLAGACQGCQECDVKQEGTPKEEDPYRPQVAHRSPPLLSLPCLFDVSRYVLLRFQYLAYALAFVWYMLCIYFSLLLGVTFTKSIADAWLLGFAISIFQVSPPFPVLPVLPLPILRPIYPSPSPL